MRAVGLMQAFLLGATLLAWGCVGPLALKESNPKDVVSPRHPGEHGECVDVMYADSLECPKGQFVTAASCPDGKVRCGGACFAIKLGASKCPARSALVTDQCPDGQGRCVPTECTPLAEGKKLACAQDRGVTTDGCPDGYVQCAP